VPDLLVVGHRGEVGADADVLDAFRALKGVYLLAVERK
jgi:hypothetical protein